MGTLERVSFVENTEGMNTCICQEGKVFPGTYTSMHETGLEHSGPLEETYFSRPERKLFGTGTRK